MLALYELLKKDFAEQEQLLAAMPLEIEGRIKEIQVPDQQAYADYIRVHPEELAFLKHRISEHRMKPLKGINPQLILNSSGVPMAIITAAGVICEANIAYCNFLGYPKHEVIGAHFNKFTPLSYQQKSLDALAELASGKRTSFSIEKQYVHARGHLLFGELNVQVLQKPTEIKEMLLVVQINDLTQRKQQEEQLKQSEANMRALLDSVPYSYYLLDTKCNIITINRVASLEVRRYLGESPQPGESVMRYLPHSQHLAFKRGFENALEGKRQSVERCINIGRKARWFEVTHNPAIDDQGTIFGATFTSLDITQRKEAELQEAQTSGRLQGILESTSEMMFALDIDLRYTEYNTGHVQQMAELYSSRISPNSFFLNAVTNAEDRSFFSEQMQKALAGEQFSLNTTLGTGRNRWFEIGFNPIYNNLKTVVGLAIFTKDITDRKISEDNSRKKQQLLSSINRNINEGIYRTELDKGWRYVNKEFVRIFGYADKEEMFAVPGEQLYAEPGMRDKLREQLLVNHSLDNVEVAFKRKDGSIFWGLTSCTLTTDRDGAKFCDGAIRDITPLKEAEERLRKLNRELTESNYELARHEEELAASNEELRANQEDMNQVLCQLQQVVKQLEERNFELDQLVYKTSHDLRSPLTSILGLVNLMKIDSNGKPDECLLRIEESIHKLDNFVRSMLNYGRASRAAQVAEPVDIEEIILQSLADVEYMPAYKRLRVMYDINLKSDIVISDKQRLSIIVSNIVSNAVKYADLEKEKCFLNIKVNSSADQVTMVFEDNGIGISEQYLSKVCDMFFRGTELSDGSGLGMYIVRQTVERLQGELIVLSEQNQGSCFTIHFPLKLQLPVN